MPGSGNKVVAGDFHRLRTTVRAGPDSTIPEVIRRKFVSNLFAHAGTIHPAGLLVKEFFGKSSQKFGSPQRSRRGEDFWRYVVEKMWVESHNDISRARLKIAACVASPVFSRMACNNAANLLGARKTSASTSVALRVSKVQRPNRLSRGSSMSVIGIIYYHSNFSWITRNFSLATSRAPSTMESRSISRSIRSSSSSSRALKL